ncbi:MAG: hypothetical protein AAGL98_05440, partial [Planctomycetota bacterium]
MAVYDNAYSRFVAWAKIILPLVALGLLSTMFLVSRDSDPAATIRIGEQEARGLAQEDGMSAPRFAG